MNVYYLYTRIKAKIWTETRPNENKISAVENVEMGIILFVCLQRVYIYLYIEYFIVNVSSNTMKLFYLVSSMF